MARGKFNDLTGQKFGMLTVKYYYGKDSRYKSYWICDCDCGKENIKVRSDCLTTGNTTSCGCYNITSKIKRVEDCVTKEKLYHVYYGMKSRCYNSNSAKYQYYGGKGIKVCDEWLESYVNFKLWSIENGYEEGLTLDRLDGDDDYKPSNCRWVSMTVQNRNKDSNNYYTYDGKTLLLSDWSKLTGIKEPTLYSRLNSLNWDFEKAITTPVK